VAINLGQSVALVLSLLTGYASAQFHLKHDDFFETVRDVNAMPQSKWQELAKFTLEEMTGKPPLPSAAKDYKRQVRLEPDHTPINHDITEDPIPVQGGHDEPQLPLQQGGQGLGETICHPPSGAPSWAPPSIRKSSLTFWYYHSIRESVHSSRTLHGASLCSA
jgi:hypothetical protein